MAIFQQTLCNDIYHDSKQCVQTLYCDTTYTYVSGVISMNAFIARVKKFG